MYHLTEKKLSLQRSFGFNEWTSITIPLHRITWGRRYPRNTIRFPPKSSLAEFGGRVGVGGCRREGVGFCLVGRGVGREGCFWFFFFFFCVWLYGYCIADFIKFDIVFFSSAITSSCNGIYRAMFYSGG